MKRPLWPKITAVASSLTLFTGFVYYRATGTVFGMSIAPPAPVEVGRPTMPPPSTDHRSVMPGSKSMKLDYYEAAPPETNTQPKPEPKRDDIHVMPGSKSGGVYRPSDVEKRQTAPTTQPAANTPNQSAPKR